MCGSKEMDNIFGSFCKLVAVSLQNLDFEVHFHRFNTIYFLVLL